MIFPKRALYLRTGFDPLAYANRILGTEAASLIAYWPMWEASGTAADNYEGTAARDGAYTGVTLGQDGIGDGNTCPHFDGINDYCNIQTASLAGVFSGVAGTVILWAKVTNVGVWTDASARYLLALIADANNRVYLTKSNANNSLAFQYRAGGTLQQITHATSTTSWFHMGFTWDKNAGATGELKAYYNGAQTDVTTTGLGVWAGALGTAAIGCRVTVPADVFDGYIAHVAIWTKALTAAQMLALASV